jgi:riboflavin biosynthesis pyrimidine reductase
VRQLFPVPADHVDLDAAYEHPEGVLRANMVSSADGAATVEGRSGGLSSEGDQALFLRLRRLCDVVLVGASTVRNENYGPGAKPIAVISASLDFNPESRFFSDQKRRPTIITTEDADARQRNVIGEVADIATVGLGRVDMSGALDLLAQRGYSRILTEGGPSMLAEIAAVDRLNELCLTLAPFVVGGHAKRILDGAAHEPPARMEPVHILEEDGHLYLRYRAVR